MDKTLKIALILTAVDKMSSIVTAATEKAEKRLKGLAKVSDKLNSFGNSSLIAGGAVTGFLATTYKDAQESAIAVQRQQQVFKTMGETTNAAADAAAKFAGQLQYQIGVQDEAIMDVQDKLATFKKASDAAARSSGLFNRITQSAFDLEAIGFGDAMSNITALGKAFQDPIKGAVALKKAGTLTSKDIDVLKIILPTKGLAVAQNYIINALERQAKGQAAIKADPVTKMKIAYSELSETMGREILPMTNRFLARLTVLIPKIDAFLQNNHGLIKSLAKVGIGLLGVGATAKVLSGAINTVTGVYKGYKVASDVVSKLNKTQGFGISNLRYKFDYLKLAITDGTKAVGGMASAGWDKLKAGLNVTVTAVTSATKAFARFAVALLTNPITWIILLVAAFAAGVYLIYKNWGTVGPWLKNMLAKIAAYFFKALEFIKNLFLKYTPAGILFSHWDKITAFFSNLWENVKGIFMGYINWVFGLGSKFVEAGANIATSIWKGIKAMAHKPIEAISAITDKISGFFPHSPAKEGALKNLHKVQIVEMIAKTIRAQPAIDAMHRVTGAIAGYSPGGSLVPVHSGSNYHININLSGGATQADADMLSRTFEKAVLRVRDKEENRQRRVSFDR